MPRVLILLVMTGFVLHELRRPRVIASIAIAAGLVAWALA